MNSQQLYDSHSHQNSDARTIALKNIEHKYPNRICCLQSLQYYSVGIHPWFIDEENWEIQLEELKDMAIMNQVLAIGECGLDKAVALDMELQTQVFKKQIGLSEALTKPLIIHAVRSYSEILSLRQSSQAKERWVFHGYNSSEQMAQQLIKAGCVLSIGKQILSESNKLEAVVGSIALSQLLIESDEDRALLPEIYNKIAKIRNLTLDELIAIQKVNFQSIFKINLDQ